MDKIFAQAPKSFHTNKALIQYMRKSKCFTRKEVQTFICFQDHHKDEMREYINDHPNPNSFKQLKETLNQWALMAEIYKMGTNKEQEAD